MMPTFRPVPLLATLGFLAIPVIATGAVAETYECQRRELMRRIEVQFADDADRLPCEVLYWRDSETGQPQSLWNAEHQLDYCRDRAREMAERLEDAGWTCDAAAVGAEAAAVPERSPPEPEDPESAAAARGTEPANPTGGPDRATLRAALARDILRLEELTAGSPGEFATETAALGDLNGDGLEDAAVLLSHRVEGAEPTRYLMAYLFDGETFQPVARINLNAYYRNFTEVGIQEVAGGAVEVVLHVPRPDDPSGRRRATFGLRNRELVLLRESEPGA